MQTGEVPFDAEDEKEASIAEVPLNQDLAEAFQLKEDEGSEIKSEIEMSVGSEKIPVKEQSEQQPSFVVESEVAKEELLEEGDQALPEEFPEDMSMSKP